ncbi:Transposon Ty3-G Gag-Pol poly, partial [Brachionus plicatilis]
LQKAYEKVRQNKNVRIRRMRLNYDRQVYAAEFKPGDLVWVRNDVIKRGQCRKFTYTWNGPYVVEQKVNQANYKIRPIKTKGKRLIVHVNRLNRHYGGGDL